MMAGQHVPSDPGGVRVLMVARLFHPWVGGAERQAHKLSRALHDIGVDVRIVTGWWFRGTRQAERIDGVPVFRNHTLWEFFGVKGLRKLGGYLYILTLMWRLWRWRGSYDVIHVHGLNYHTFAAVLAGRLLNKPTLSKLANSGPASDILKMKRGQQLALSRLMLPTALTCDRFVALNPAVVNELVAAGVQRARIVELPNGVDTSCPARREYRLHHPATIVYVGRLHEQKGIDLLLREFALLSQRRRAELRLRLVGDGPARDRLEALARRLGLSDWVDFLGEVPDVAPYLHGADVFVLPSRAEGISNALLEAMSCGLPVAVSDIPGNRDVVVDGETGLVVAAEQPGALAETLFRLLDDRRLREQLGTAARRTAEDRYSLQGVARCYVALYDELLRGVKSLPALVTEDRKASA